MDNNNNPNLLGFIEYSCSKCGRNSAEFWAAPCGHLLCADCQSAPCTQCTWGTWFPFGSEEAFRLFLTALGTTEASGALTNAACPICLGELTNAEAICECGHVFCGACLRRWQARGSDTCPTCRVPIGRPIELRAGRVNPALDEEEDYWAIDLGQLVNVNTIPFLVLLLIVAWSIFF